MSSIISIFGLFLQLYKFQSKTDLSPFETNYSTMLIFFIALLTHLVSSAGVVSKDHGDRASNLPTQLMIRNIFSKISILSGSLASILLLLIIFSVIGWLALVLWILYFVKNVYELIYEEKIQILDMLYHQIKKILDVLRKMKRPQSEREQDHSLPKFKIEANRDVRTLLYIEKFRGYIIVFVFVFLATHVHKLTFLINVCILFIYLFHLNIILNCYLLCHFS